MNARCVRNGSWLAVAISIAAVSGNAAAQNARAMDPAKAGVIEHWTPERRANAIPRDLVIDPRGLGYLRRPDGSLIPHGHDIAAEAPSQRQTPSPRAKPAGGSGDTTPPEITGMDPGPIPIQTIGASYPFSATVIDASDVKSVTFKVQKVGSTVQSFSATKAANSDTWSVSLQGFTDGDWNWWVEAKDNAPRGGNLATSATVAFKVSTGSTGGGGGGGTSDTVTNAHWTAGGAVKSATGRIYFEMPGNAKRKVWWGYVCSGTVATDGTPERSVIITAAHCIYDDANKAFARNVMFIPDQDGTTGSATDRNCSNDPIGCWVPSFGVVDREWTVRTFPANIAWDYGFYVVPDAGAHSGSAATSEALDAAVQYPLPVNFATMPFHGDGAPGKLSPDFTYALGYSYSDDPKLMYCAEDMTTEGAVNWWLPSCLLSGGSSGGPWIQPMSPTGFGDIISVNSWGYTSSPGMAGPRLVGTSASCIFSEAKAASFFPTPPADGDAGRIEFCP